MAIKYTLFIAVYGVISIDFDFLVVLSYLALSILLVCTVYHDYIQYKLHKTYIVPKYTTSIVQPSTSMYSSSNFFYYINIMTNNVRTPLSILIYMLDKFDIDVSTITSPSPINYDPVESYDKLRDLTLSHQMCVKSSVNMISYYMYNFLFYEKIINDRANDLTPSYRTIFIKTLFEEISLIIQQHYCIENIKITYKGKLSITVEKIWVRQIILNTIMLQISKHDDNISIIVDTSDTQCKVIIETPHKTNVRDIREANMYNVINKTIIDKLNIQLYTTNHVVDMVAKSKNIIKKEPINRYFLNIPVNIETNMPNYKRNPIFGIIADDIVINAYIIAEGLKQYNIICDTVSSGEDLINAYRKNPTTYDFILTDYIMPNMNGDQAIATIKKISNRTPLSICMTGDTLQDIDIFDAVLYKPINVANIISILDANNIIGRETASPASSHSSVFEINGEHPDIETGIKSDHSSTL